MKPSRLLTHCIAKTIPIGFLLRKHIFGFYTISILMLFNMHVA